MRVWVAIGLAAAVLAGCKEEETTTEAPIRAIKAHVVTEVEATETRRYPAVLEPSDLTAVSFEINGILGPIDLDVGARLKKGDIVAELDRTSLELQVESSQAAVDQARVQAENAAETLTRNETLLERGVTTQVVVDDSRTQAESTKASLTQAERALDSAKEELNKAELVAPFDGIINSVEVKAYETVSPGMTIATLYSESDFEVSFSVSFDAVSQLVVGTPAEIRLADRPDIVLPAMVNEIGERADNVSSFPIVLRLNEGNPILKAGMSVEAGITYPLSETGGYLIPPASLIKSSPLEEAGGEARARIGRVFVFDADSSTVKERETTVGGIRENKIIVLDGLTDGDIVATAGVSFLRDGMEVSLLESGE